MARLANSLSFSFGFYIIYLSLDNFGKRDEKVGFGHNIDCLRWFGNECNRLDALPKKPYKTVAIITAQLFIKPWVYGSNLW